MKNMQSTKRGRNYPLICKVRKGEETIPLGTNWYVLSKFEKNYENC